MITGWWAAGLAAFAGTTHAVMAAGFLGRQRWAWALGAGSYAVLAALGPLIGPLWLMGFGVTAGAFACGWLLHPEAVAKQRHKDNPVVVNMDGSDQFVVMSRSMLARIPKYTPPDDHFRFQEPPAGPLFPRYLGAYGYYAGLVSMNQPYKNNIIRPTSES